MAGYVIIGVLAAFGALCVAWVLFGLLLPRPKGSVLVYFCGKSNEESVLRRYFWLRDLGFLRCGLVMLDSSLSPRRQQQILDKYRDVTFCTWDEWKEEQERTLRGRIGNGNAAGNHCSGGLPEL